MFGEKKNENQFFSLFFSYRLPWNQHTKTGFVIEIFFDGFGAISYFCINSTYLTYFIALCTYHRAFQQMIKALLDKLKERNTPRQAKQILIDVVRVHNNAKLLFRESADAYSSVIMFFSIFIMIAIACGIFHMDVVSYLFKKKNDFETKKKKIIFFTFLGGASTKYRNHFNDVRERY